MAPLEVWPVGTLLYGHAFHLFEDYGSKRVGPFLLHVDKVFGPKKSNVTGQDYVSYRVTRHWPYNGISFWLKISERTPEEMKPEVLRLGPTPADPIDIPLPPK